MKMRQSRVRRMSLIALFTALLAASAFVRIPVPPVPVTLQAQIALLSGMLIGPVDGASAAGLYVLLGFLGVPVFAGGGGPGYVLQPTFGYLLGFIGGAAVCGALSRRTQAFKRLLLAQLAGLTVIYICGVLWYGVSVSVLNGQFLGTQRLLAATLLTTLPTDLVLAVVEAIAVNRVLPYLKHIGF